MQEHRILYQDGNYHITSKPPSKPGKNRVLEVWRNNGVAAVRIGVVGYPGAKGFDYAKMIIAKSKAR